MERRGQKAYQRSIGRFLVLGILLGVWCVPLFAQETESPSQPQPTEALEKSGAISEATSQIPPAVQTVLTLYSKSFELEDERTFADCFWDAEPYLKSFNTVARDWFDIRVEFQKIQIVPLERSDRLKLKVELRSRLRERRTKRLVPLDSTAEFLFEKRDAVWRLLSIQAGEARVGGKG